MIYPSADKIDKEIDSKYALVVLAAKRARQIKEGGRLLIDTRSTNPLTIALEEIASGRVKYEFDESSLAGQEALEDARAVVGNRNMEGDGNGDGEAIPDNVRAAYAQLGAELDDTAILGDDEAGDDLVDDEVDDEEPPVTLDDDSEGTGA